MNYYTDKTVEDALASAAAEKGCDLEDLKYFVKEEKKRNTWYWFFCNNWCLHNGRC